MLNAALCAYNTLMESKLANCIIPSYFCHTRYFLFVSTHSTSLPK